MDLVTKGTAIYFMIMKFHKNIKFVDGVPSARFCCTSSLCQNRTRIEDLWNYKADKTRFSCGAYGLMEKADNKRTNVIILDSDKSYNESHV